MSRTVGRAGETLGGESIVLGCGDNKIACGDQNIGCAKMPHGVGTDFIGCGKQQLGCAMSALGCGNNCIGCAINVQGRRTHVIGCATAAQPYTNVPSGLRNRPIAVFARKTPLFSGPRGTQQKNPHQRFSRVPRSPTHSSGRPSEIRAPDVPKRGADIPAAGASLCGLMREARVRQHASNPFVPPTLRARFVAVTITAHTFSGKEISHGDVPT